MHIPSVKITTYNHANSKTPFHFLIAAVTTTPVVTAHTIEVEERRFKVISVFSS